jgi:lipopolysaccharide transport system permease protein
LDGDNNYTDLILKLTTTNLIHLFHNSIVVILSFIAVEIVPSFAALLILVTISLVTLNIIWICVIVSILSTRYPDLGEFIKSSLRFLFFITPVLWVPHQHVRGWFVDALLFLNPFYYMIEVVRNPLLDGQVPYSQIAVLVALLLIGWVAASLLYARTRPWLALWL